MELRMIGAGLPRTGTTSLKQMLEQLLDGGCYHMSDLYKQPDVDGPGWMAALNGDLGALDELLTGYVAAVDWPASALWRELAALNPEALVVLSHRESSATWWESADRTVWEVMRKIRDGAAPEHVPGIHRLMRERAGFDEAMGETEARARYESHFAEVIAEIPAERLVVWHPAQGWDPLCNRLGLPLPEALPVHANTSMEFRDRLLPDGDR